MFPIDMLRYDTCFPASEEDGHKIVRAIRGEGTDLLFAAIGLAILVGALAPSLSDARGFGFAFGFANRVAGSYLGEFNDGVNPPFPGLFAFNRDGTAQGSFNNEGDIGTPMYGAWRRTGLREIEGTFLDFHYDPETGLPNAIVRIDFTTTFDKGFNAFKTTNLVISYFYLTQDPLDPEETPIAKSSGTVTGQRIPAVQNN